MKALNYEEFRGELRISNLRDPSPETHGVIIEVKATGLCRSDWHGWMGHDPDIRFFPHVPGHELAGIVVEVGKNVRKYKKGDRVTVPFVCGCGTCPQCESNNQQICDFQTQPGFTHWGSFAEYVKIDFADINLVRLPESISFNSAAVLGCRFTTAYRAVLDQGKLEEGNLVAVHGCGGVGLSAIMIAKSKGAFVVAVDINDEALSLADKLGADLVINGRSNDGIAEEIKERTKGGVHISIDALGNKTTCKNSILNLRKRGRHIQVGLLAGDEANPQIPMANVISHELEIIGSHGMQAHRFPELLEMIKNGKLNPELLINKNISLVDAKTALPKMNEFNSQGVLIINDFAN